RDLLTNMESFYDILPLNYVSTDPGTTLFADNFTEDRVYIFKTGFMGSTLEFSNENGANKHTLYTTYLNNFTAMANVSDASDEIYAAFSDFEAVQVELLHLNFTDPNNPSNTHINLPEAGIINGILIDENNPEIFTIT